jgi:glycosyltransferase involved in cell wall biosynthesis
MKYPNILLFRYDNYSHIDAFFETNKDKLLCSVNIINNNSELNKLFDANYHLLITFGNNHDEYCRDVNYIITDRMRRRWLHFAKIDDVDSFNSSVNYCYMGNIVDKHVNTRPIFSLFTTCYNSYEKILRAYNSVKSQTLKDWEWVILDDSPDDKHFEFLKNLFKYDKRIRLYNRSENSGNIGNVKNEAVSLCRGKYVLELDHDDEILPNVLFESTKVFEENNEIGFVYMDFSNIYEDGNNFSYGNHFALGYSGYYRQKYDNKWLYVAVTPNINNVSLSHIVSVPNHPRIWRKSTLLEMGNYSEFLPISDDYELLVRTAANTKIAKIHKLGYIQYMNNNSNNFSLIRNSEINRLRVHLTHHCYNKYNIDDVMKLNNSYEQNTIENNNKPVWKRSDEYTYLYCNKLINMDYKRQYCIIGLETLYKNYYQIKQLYADRTTEFFLLDNKYNSNDNTLCNVLDNLNFDRMKCYSMDDCSDQELFKYFNLICKSCDDFIIIQRNEDIPITDIPTTDITDINNESNNIINLASNEKKKITIITPSIRPHNLLKIKESINFDYVNEWIIVYDETKIKENPNIFSNEKNDKIKEYVYKGPGRSGNPQRNYAIDNIQNPDTYLYFLDDDNIIHPELYKLLHDIQDNKIYTFDQKRPKDVFPYKEYLEGNKVELFCIDSAMFLVDYNLCKNIRWEPHKYNSDGIYIMECYSLNRDNWIYVDKLLSYYNYII